MEYGMKIAFGEAVLKEAHPNTAQLYLKGISGKTMELVGQSLGGGRINIAEIDGIETNFSGENPTLIVHNLDQPGHVSEVTSKSFYPVLYKGLIYSVCCDILSFTFPPIFQDRLLSVHLPLAPANGFPPAELPDHTPQP